MLDEAAYGEKQPEKQVKSSAKKQKLIEENIPMETPDDRRLNRQPSIV